MEEKFNYKRIADPIHGTIGLSELEIEIINTRAFQRLRNIKQLGLVYLVFPSADYSRFSHSLGVCHITGKFIDSLEQRLGNLIDDETKQKFRLAGLLHDIGHYPFSHAFESAVDEFYPHGDEVTSSIEENGEDNDSRVNQGIYWKHETVGEKLLKKDDEIKNILANCEYKFTPHDIYSIFLGKEPDYEGIVSSDLDADRIDYLLRTSLHTGLPYGSVDIDYLISQIEIDGNKHICFNSKALRTAEHCLIARYFDYLQVTYHKSVMGFERIFKDIVSELLNNTNDTKIKCSSIDLLGKFNGAWYEFDDSYILTAIRDQSSKVTDPLIKEKFKAFLNRKPPKLVWSGDEVMERFDFPYDTSKYKLKEKSNMIKNQIPSLAAHFKIDLSLWYLIEKKDKPVKFTKVYPIDNKDVKESEEYQNPLRKVVRISESKETSKPIFECKESLLSELSKFATYPLRLYVLFPEDRHDQRDKLAKEIKAKIESLIGN